MANYRPSIRGRQTSAMHSTRGFLQQALTQFEEAEPGTGNRYRRTSSYSGTAPSPTGNFDQTGPGTGNRRTSSYSGTAPSPTGNFDQTGPGTGNRRTSSYSGTAPSSTDNFDQTGPGTGNRRTSSYSGTAPSPTGNFDQTGPGTGNRRTSSYSPFPTGNFSGTSNQGSSQVQRPSWLTERKSVFGRRAKKSKKVKLSMWEHEFICLSQTGQVCPPSPMDKAELIRAGLGPRKLSFFEFGDAGEFHEMITSAYPKLIHGGGYELLRTLPSNHKEICVIPPPAGGYTVTYLKNIVSQAKVYIRPIQIDLSLDFILDDEDLEPALTEQCMQCGRYIAMHQLREHLETCSSASSQQTHHESPPLAVSPTHTHQNPPPSCVERTHYSRSQHAQQTLQDHVIILDDGPVQPFSESAPSSPFSVLLGEGGDSSPSPPPYSPITPAKRPPTTVDVLEEEMIADAIKRSLTESMQILTEPEPTSREPTSLQDIILALQRECGLQIPTDGEGWATCPRTSIDVRREELIKTSFREARKSRFDHAKLLNVHFVGENGIDTGGLSREFWRVICDAIVKNYCIGDTGKSIFIRNVPALQNGDFKLIGKLVATSILQGGCGFPLLLPAVYHYITTGDYLGLTSDNGDIPYIEVRELLKLIDDATSDEELRLLFTDSDQQSLLLETGFRNPLALLTMDDKPSIRKVLQDHHTLVKVKAEIDQFVEGLKTAGVLDQIIKHPTLMAPMLVSSKGKVKINKDFFRSLLQANFSRDNPLRRSKEEEAYIYFCDFIEECEDGTAVTDDGDPVTPEDILIFFTGANQPPPLGFTLHPRLEFEEVTLASASTCTLRLTLPLQHENYESFKDNMILSLLGHGGFGLT